MYKELYLNLIIDAKISKSAIENGYFERHHFIPRSMGGSDSPENIVSLTARQHFLAHYFLWKHFLLEANDKTAADKMCKAIIIMHRQMKLTENAEEMAKLYQEARIQHSENMKISMKGSGNPFFGKHHSEETLKKMSDNRKGKYTGINNKNFGKHLSEEHKQKISIAKKGKHLSEETRKKMSIAKKGKNHPFFGKHFSAEHKKKLSDSRPKKAVKQYTKNGEFIAEYPSAIEAERKTGIGRNNILRCCNGKRKSTGGYVWKYTSV